jgi:putative PIN family toxin of toxin-antitoxin system
MELAEVLARSKFDRYLTVSERQEFLRLFGRIAERIRIIHVVHACRDPKDDKFLELAVNCSAHLMMTGDADLLVLRPFRGIDILSPASYLGAFDRVDPPGAI